MREERTLLRAAERDRLAPREPRADRGWRIRPSQQVLAPRRDAAPYPAVSRPLGRGWRRLRPCASWHRAASLRERIPLAAASAAAGRDCRASSAWPRRRLVSSSRSCSGRAAPGASPLLAGFEARSYCARRRSPCSADRRRHGPRHAPDLPRRRVRDAGPVAAHGWDKHTFGKPVTAPAARCPAPRDRAWLAHVPLGADWPSGDYVARLTWRAHTDYAPFVLRPKRLGTAPVLVIEPTNTWHAYDDVDGDSWYLNSAVHVIDLTHPFPRLTRERPAGPRRAARAVQGLRPRLPPLVLARAATAPTSSPTTTSRRSRASSSSSATG